MSLTILDLDEPSTWNEGLRELVYADNMWPILLTDYYGNGEKYQELNCAPRHVTDPLIKTLRDKCDDLIQKHYSHFAAYHACRTDDPDKYRRDGIQTSSRERLTAIPKSVFNGIPGLETALATCDSYFQMYDGSVSLYSTARYVITDYLSGSHYLLMVANELGEKAHARLQQKNASGQSVFIKCRLPISWLNDPRIVSDLSLHLYSTSLIKKLIVTKVKGLDNYADTPFSLVVFCAIPSKCVDSIIAVQS